ncbi:MAG: glycosyltransferase family 39 protein [Phycisphaerae bacterium]|nr:glycosyltransferase family 39 protein [Phycisphaerae bacterium]
MNTPAQHLSARHFARRRRIVATIALFAWLALMAPLIRWGLPTSRYDDLLFGGEPPWDAARYNSDAALAELRNRQAGADTDLNPRQLDAPTDITATDAERAEILRRYRLYSHQPDEMITFRALQRMNPRSGDFDPKLYQYGGGYIYLIAAALVAAYLAHLVHVTGDVTYYLNSPEAFAQFYLVARAVSLLFGAVMLCTVYRLGRRVGGRHTGWIAAILTAACPVFLANAVEAKPHLPSATLLLLAALFALRYYDHRRLRDAVLLGLCSGYAVGLVLTGAVAAVLWPLLLLAFHTQPNSDKARKRQYTQLAIAAIIAAAVYAITNPYVILGLIGGGGSLTSNISNSTSMYRVGNLGGGLMTVADLLVEAAGAGVALIGMVGFVLLLRRDWWRTLMAAGAGIALLAICVAIGAGKPAEYARFLVFPATLLALASAGIIGTLQRRLPLLALTVGLATLLLCRTPAYVRALATDAGGATESRACAASYLEELIPTSEPIALVQEPGPYATPPIDFAHRMIILLPSQPTAQPIDPATLPQWLVVTADDAHRAEAQLPPGQYELVKRFGPSGLWSSRITWANKPVFVYYRTNMQ